MNERIRELAEQAGFYVTADKIYIPTISEEITDCQTKFAELIVKECISVRTELTQFDGTTEYGDGYENGLKDMAEVIAEMFGVEE